jgi:hypothetical protein
METVLQGLGTALKVVGAPIALYAIMWMSSVDASRVAHFGQIAYVPTSGMVWNHRFECDARAASSQAESGAVYFWLKNTGTSTVPDYLLSPDRSFLQSALLRKDFGDSYWRPVEAGSGPDLCMDYVSVDSNSLRLARPYCAREFKLGTQEYFERSEDGKLQRHGLCQQITASP